MRRLALVRYMAAYSGSTENSGSPLEEIMLPEAIAIVSPGDGYQVRHARHERFRFA